MCQTYYAKLSFADTKSSSASPVGKWGRWCMTIKGLKGLGGGAHERDMHVKYIDLP